MTGQIDGGGGGQRQHASKRQRYRKMHRVKLVKKRLKQFIRAQVWQDKPLASREATDNEQQGGN